MKKRATKLYDSITDLDEGCLLEAEQFRPGAGISWKTWGGVAAAIVLTVGVAAGIPGMNMGMAGATDDSAPSASDYCSKQENASMEHAMDSAHAVLRGGELRLDSGEVYLILEEVDWEPPAEELKGADVRYLEWVDGRYILREGPTDLVIFCGDSEELILRDGAHYYSLQKTD